MEGATPTENSNAASASASFFPNYAKGLFVYSDLRARSLTVRDEGEAAHDAIASTYYGVVALLV